MYLRYRYPLALLLATSSASASLPLSPFGLKKGASVSGPGRQLAEDTGKIVDLSKDYEVVTPTPEIGLELEAIAADEPNINAFVAIECGKIVGEYYDEGKNNASIFHLWSMTKTWSGLLFGVMVKEGLISVDETLGEIWPEEGIWPNGTEARQNITVEQILQMRSGLQMPR